jgi:hypothetical protein
MICKIAAYWQFPTGAVRANIDLQIKIVDSPYITADIFIEYLRGIVIPGVERNRSLPRVRK